MGYHSQFVLYNQVSLEVLAYDVVFLVWFRLYFHFSCIILKKYFVELLKALRYLRRVAAEENGEINIRNGQHPAVLRTLSQRLAK